MTNIISLVNTLSKIYLPQMTNVVFVAQVQFSVVGKQSLLLVHAQVSKILVAAKGHNFYEPSVPFAAVVSDFPLVLLIATADVVLVEDGDEFLGEGVVDEVAIAFFLGDELPEVVLDDVGGGVGAGRNLVDLLVLRVSDLMGVQEIFCLQVAESQKFLGAEIFPSFIELGQRFLQSLDFLFIHLCDGARDNRQEISVEAAEGLVDIIAEGGIDLGVERRLVETLFFIDDRICLPLFAISAFAPVFLVVILPFLHFGVADAHNHSQSYIQQCIYLLISHRLMTLTLSY